MRSPSVVGAEGASFAAETYEGVELQVGEGGAYAFVGDMLVIGHRGREPPGRGRCRGRRRGARRAAPTSVQRWSDFRPITSRRSSSTSPASWQATGLPRPARRPHAPPAPRWSPSRRAAPQRQRSVRPPSRPSARGGFALGGERRARSSSGCREATIAEARHLRPAGRPLEDAEAAIGSAPGGEEVARHARHHPRARRVRTRDRPRRRPPAAARPRGRRSRISGFDGNAASRPAPAPARGSDAAVAFGAGRRPDRCADRRRRDDDRETVAGTEVVTLDAARHRRGRVVRGGRRHRHPRPRAPRTCVAAIEAHADGAHARRQRRATCRTFEVAGDRAGNEACVDIGALVDASRGGSRASGRRARYPVPGSGPSA